MDDNKKFIEIQLIENEDKLWNYDDSKARKKTLFSRHRNAISLPFEGLLFYVKGIQYKLIGTRNIEVVKRNNKLIYIVDLIKNTSTNKTKAYFRQDLVRIIQKQNE